MARKERKYHYIYKITCLKNNRYYIGMHSTDNLEDGYLGGGKRIKNSVKKHGKDAHKKEILEFFENREDLKKRESELVNEELLNDPMCVNLQPGGGGGIIDEIHHSKLKEGASKWIIEKWKDPEYRMMQTNLKSERYKKLHKEGKMRYDTFKGKKHTPESLEKMRNADRFGEKNSQFGTFWIFKDGISMKVKPQDLESKLSEGWRRGRK